MAKTKVAVTIPEPIMNDVRERAAEAGVSVSAWLEQAARERVEREDLRRRGALEEFVAEDLATFGPIPDEMRAEVLEQWPR